MIRWMSEIFFDNSALSRIVEEPEPDRTALVAGLRTLGTLRVSSLNVLETVKTPDDALRETKLRFYKSVAGSVAPINRPIEVLAKVARAYHDKSGHIQVGDQHLYALLLDPALATAELRRAVTEQSVADETKFRTIFREMRTRVQPTPSAATEKLFENEDAFLDFAFANVETTMGHMVTEAYCDITGAVLPMADVTAFLDAAPAWKAYVAAHLHELWVRAVREHGPGKKKAGAVDTESAVYLNFCGRFITNDRKQFDALVAANRFNPRGTVVELYDDLRSRLLL